MVLLLLIVLIIVVVYIRNVISGDTGSFIGRVCASVVLVATTYTPVQRRRISTSICGNTTMNHRNMVTVLVLVVLRMVLSHFLVPFVSQVIFRRERLKSY